MSKNKMAKEERAEYDKIAKHLKVATRNCESYQAHFEKTYKKLTNEIDKIEEKLGDILVEIEKAKQSGRIGAYDQEAFAQYDKLKEEQDNKSKALDIVAATHTIYEDRLNRQWEKLFDLYEKQPGLMKGLDDAEWRKMNDLNERRNQLQEANEQWRNELRGVDGKEAQTTSPMPPALEKEVKSHVKAESKGEETKAAMSNSNKKVKEDKQGVKTSLSQKLGLSTPPLKQIKTLNTKLAKINASTKKAEQKVELKATAYNKINARIETADDRVKSLTDKLKAIDSTGRRVADVKAEKNQIKQQIQALKEQIQIDRKTRKTSLAEYNNAQKSQAKLFEKNSKERASILLSQEKIIKQNPEISDTAEKAPAAYKPKLHMLDSKKTIDTSEIKKELEVATKAYKKQKTEAKKVEKDYDKKVSKLAKKTAALTKAEKKEAPLRNKVAQTETKLANNNRAAASSKQNLQLHQKQLAAQEQALKDIRTKILSDNPGDLKALLKQEKALEKQIGKTQGLITTTEKQIAKYALKEEKLNITLTKQKEVLTAAQERKGFFSKGSKHRQEKVDTAKAQLMENAIAQRDATTKPHARTDAVHAQIDAELPRTIEKQQSRTGQASSPTLQSDEVASTPPNGNTRIYNPTAQQPTITTTGPVQDVLKSSMAYMQSVKWPDGNTIVKAVELS